MLDSVADLELVGDFLIERKRENFVLDKANFADIASSYGEKIQRSIKQNLPLVAN